MTALESEFLFEMKAGLGGMIPVGPGPLGNRVIVTVPGGTFEGPKLKGTIVANSGADWAYIRNDGSLALDVRLCLETDDGAFIYMTYTGRIVPSSPEQLAEILDFNRAEPVDPSTYYFRSNPVFETGSEQYAWLNSIVAVGKGRAGDGGVAYDVFAIK